MPVRRPTTTRPAPVHATAGAADTERCTATESPGAQVLHGIDKDQAQTLLRVAVLVGTGVRQSTLQFVSICLE